MPKPRIFEQPTSKKVFIPGVHGGAPPHGRAPASSRPIPRVGYQHLLGRERLCEDPEVAWRPVRGPVRFSGGGCIVFAVGRRPGSARQHRQGGCPHLVLPPSTGMLDRALRFPSGLASRSGGALGKGRQPSCASGDLPQMPY